MGGHTEVSSATSTLAGSRDQTREKSIRGSSESSRDGPASVALDEKNTTAKEMGGEVEDGDEEEQIEYPGSMKLVFITIALCLAVFLIALDQTIIGLFSRGTALILFADCLSIIATAIPKITDQFKSLDSVGWYGSAYMLTVTLAHCPVSG